MTTFAVTSNNQVLDSVNYLLSNLSTGNVTGNITVPAGTLVANVATGQITATGNVSAGANAFSYLNQWINLRYANNATGSSGFSTVPTNSLYFGVYNSNIATPSSNPTEYVWREVAGGFGTTKTIYYSSIGGRQIQFVAANVAPSSNFVVSVANVAIDLDVITTAAGTPGERGPVVMSYVLTTADPTTASSSTLTGWFSAPRTNSVAPIGTGLSPVVGDTALFTYIPNPLSQFSINAAYEYNGSVWVSVEPQVVSGAAVVPGSLNGNAVIGNTMSGSAITDETLAGDKLLFNTITGNKIVFNTITGNLIAANTITGNTIQVGTLTGNLIAANTITANNIAADTIVGNNIAAGTITTDKLAANVLTANTVVSTGATIGSFSSPGFWLQGSTGNARFGNTISIGNNLTVGNNASIGGNLTVSGLISTGNLVANTVATTTIVANAVSDLGIAFNPGGTSQISATNGAWTYLLIGSPSTNPIVNVNSATFPQTVYLGGSTLGEFQFNATTAYNVTLDVGLFSVVYGTPNSFTQVYNLRSQTFAGNIGTANVSVQADFVGYSDTIGASTGNRGYTYGIRFTRNSGNINSTVVNFDNYNLQTQVLKR